MLRVLMPDLVSCSGGFYSARFQMPSCGKGRGVVVEAISLVLTHYGETEPLVSIEAIVGGVVVGLAITTKVPASGGYWRSVWSSRATQELFNAPSSDDAYLALFPLPIRDLPYGAEVWVEADNFGCTTGDSIAELYCLIDDDR